MDKLTPVIPRGRIDRGKTERRRRYPTLVNAGIGGLFITETEYDAVNNDTLWPGLLEALNRFTSPGVSQAPAPVTLNPETTTVTATGSVSAISISTASASTSASSTAKTSTGSSAGDGIVVGELGVLGAVVVGLVGL